MTEHQRLTWAEWKRREDEPGAGCGSICRPSSGHWPMP